MKNNCLLDRVLENACGNMGIKKGKQFFSLGLSVVFCQIPSHCITKCEASEENGALLSFLNAIFSTAVETAYSSKAGIQNLAPMFIL